MKKISWLVLIFAVLYVTWHLGRHYEAGRPVKLVYCAPTEDPEYVNCMTVSAAARDSEELYRAFMKSVGEPEGATSPIPPAQDDPEAGPVAGKMPMRGF